MTNDNLTDFIIISGLSGSGKSVALLSLEDIGYYCVDNLPTFLLAGLAQHLTRTGAQQPNRVAVTIDSRNLGFLDELDQALAVLESRGYRYRVLYLRADEAVLVRRYSETRRKHPLTDEKTSLLDGIRFEGELIKPLLDRADHILNTSATTAHELRALIRDFAGSGLSAEPLLVLESFGYKYGLPREADFVFDVRCLANPYWQEKLRAQTGLDQAVIDFLSAHATVNDMVDRIYQFLAHWLPGFADQNRSYITIAIGCTGGQHRSVYICEQLAARFRKHSRELQVRHRELPDEA